MSVRRTPRPRRGARSGLLVLGSTTPTWSPADERIRPCRIYRGDRLPPWSFCLACGRASTNVGIPALTAAERAALSRASKAIRRHPAGLAGGTGPARPGTR